MSVIGLVLLSAGVLLMLIAAIGLIRLQDPLQRMHSATKAGTLGATLLITGALLRVDDVEPSTAFLAVAFLLMTLPVGAQLLGRATYLSGIPLKGVSGSVIEELESTEQGKHQPRPD